MSSLWADLLFLHGHITDPELARRLAQTETPKPRPKGKRERTPSLLVTAGKTLAPSKLAHGGCG